MKRAIFGAFILSSLLAAGAVLALPAGTPQAAETPEGFVGRIQGLLQNRNFPAYLETFEPGLRADEQGRLDMFFTDYRMTAVSLRPAGIKRAEGGLVRAFLQAFYQNAHQAMIESWTLTLENRSGAWTVVGKETKGNLTTLYKIQIPSERAERVRRVEVSHKDIRIAFTDAAVFYGDVPGLETALVIIGKGKVVFSPGDTNERHQLELLYKKARLEDDIDYLFVRCSSSFFSSNIVLDKGEGAPAVSPEERSRAAAVFARNYPRSFTIESSLDGGLLSFLPQGDEAVLEFKARRAGELSYIYYPFSGDEVNLFDRGKDRIVSLYSPQPDSTPPLKRFFISFEEKYDITSYAIDLSYSPGASFLSGKARIAFVPKSDLLDSLKFRFNPGLKILKITDEDGRELFYTQDKLRGVLYVYLVSPSPAPAAIEISYQGRILPAAPMTDAIAQGVTKEPFVLRPRYETYFFSHEEDWYPGPAKEDYFVARLTLAIPQEYQCVANGEMVVGGGRDESGDVAGAGRAGRSVTTFVCRAPVKYLSFIVGKLERRKERAGPVPVTTFVSPEIHDMRPAIVDQAADIIDFYGQAFGPYPYDRLGIVLRFWPTFGGHSPASFIVINEGPPLRDTGYAPRTDAPVDLSEWDEYFLAHEIAHQWWGQGVTFASYKDQWLSEGLSQFAAASYLRRKHGEASFAGILKKFARWTEKKSYRGPIVMGSRLSHYDFAAYQSIVYDKAAMALFMLQDLLGRETFEAGLRGFFEKHKFQAARTAQFTAAMEAASGRDLKAFFRGWFYDYELPEVRTTWTETTVPEGVRLDIRVSQHKGPFVFPLWVEWGRAGEVGRKMIVVDGATKEFSLILPKRPGKLRFNPDQAVPGKFY